MTFQDEKTKNIIVQRVADMITESMKQKNELNESILDFFRPQENALKVPGNYIERLDRGGEHPASPTTPANDARSDPTGGVPVARRLPDGTRFPLPFLPKIAPIEYHYHGIDLLTLMAKDGDVSLRSLNDNFQNNRPDYQTDHFAGLKEKHDPEDTLKALQHHHRTMLFGDTLTKEQRAFHTAANNLLGKIVNSDSTQSIVLSNDERNTITNMLKYHQNVVDGVGEHRKDWIKSQQRGRK